MLNRIKRVLNETPDIKLIQDDLPTRVSLHTIIPELIFERPRTYYLNNRVHCYLDRNRSLSDIIKLCIYHLEPKDEDKLIKDVIETVYDLLKQEECDSFWCPDIEKMVFTPDTPFWSTSDENLDEIQTEFDEFSFLDVYQNV